MQTTLTQGSSVVMHFSLTLEDGTEVVSSQGSEPLAFTLGDGTLETALEAKLIGMKCGDERTLSLDGSDIYGEHDPANQQWMKKTDFPQSDELQEGQVIAFSAGEQEALAGTVQRIEEERVLVDFNHPLSGRRLIFSATILKIEDRE